MLKSENTNYTYILQGGGARLSAFGGYFSLLDRLKSLLCRYSKGTVQFSHSEDEIRRISLNEGSFAYAQDDNARHSECGARRISVPEVRHYNASWIIDGLLCKDDENVIVNEVKQSRKRDCGQLSSPAIPLDSQQKWIASSQAPRNDRIRSRNNVRDDRLWHILQNTCHRGRRKPVRDLKKKAAFTLAEVLITLGIIGIVAAMTLPMLVAKYQKLVVTTQLKRVYSLLSNIELMAIEEHGDRKNWEYPISTRDEDGNYVPPPISNAEFFKRYYESYIRTSGVRDRNNNDKYNFQNYNGITSGLNGANQKSFFRLSDGTCVFGWSNNQFVTLTVDINCEKKPNIIGHDVFDIATVRDTGRQTFKLEPPLPMGKNETRQNLIDNCKGANYNGGFPNRCFTLFVYDGWQFKDDYPWR